MIMHYSSIFKQFEVQPSSEHSEQQIARKSAEICVGVGSILQWAKNAEKHLRIEMKRCPRGSGLRLP
jgi:hypothetical protein